MYGINHGKLHKMNIPPETRPILPKKEMSSSKSLNFAWLLVSGILNNPMFQSNPITFTSEKKKKHPQVPRAGIHDCAQQPKGLPAA